MILAEVARKNSPLSAEILVTPNPTKIKIPNMTAFDGTTCTEEHINAHELNASVHYKFGSAV